MDQPKWVWEQTDEKRSGSSGDVAKLFKNEGVKQPGPFAAAAPLAEATLMAREVIQNSWDAARELRSQLGDAAPDFQIEFEFSERVGESKRRIAQHLDLGGLKSHLNLVETSRNKIGLGATNALDHLESDTPLKVLTISETGTTGMYGPFKQAKSKLYLALISVGYTMKDAGSGGSYGYGKAGLIAGSAIRTVVAYTCFRERADDPGVTRRLLGMTYWGQHELGLDSFTGFARFGHHEDGWVRPFENDAADAVAASLGLKLRDPGAIEDLGTTFVVVDSEVEPEDLRTAITRNWWPAMIDDAFHPIVRRVKPDGQVEKFDLRPRKDPLLMSFIRAWELATTPQDNLVPTELRKDLGKAPTAAGSQQLGFIGLHADLGGWSYSHGAPAEGLTSDDDDDVSSETSLVALVRGPRMVVEYVPYLSGKPPFLRGVFLASDEADDLLRQTEPKAHDAWETKAVEEGIDVRAPLVADAVMKKIRSTVRDFQKRLKPPPPDPGDVRLPIFQDLFKNLMTGQGRGKPKPPPAAERDVSVNLKQSLEIAPNGRDVMLRAEAEFALSPHFREDTARVIARFSYKYLEDGASGEKCPIAVTPPKGFEAVEGGYLGVLGRVPVHFDIQSEPYSADWSGRLVVVCELDKSGAPALEEGGGE
ncbi:MAG: hypothetical protein ABMA25_00380 [Ilumatobacteraceae bacterium]